MRLDAFSEARLALLTNAPADHWIALSSDESRIVGEGETFEEAASQAALSGEDDPLLIHVPSDWSVRVL